MTDAEAWGPLAGLIGAWEGDAGVDVAFSHARGEIFDTPYRERTTFSAFGPVDNGTQQLFGLDYRMAAWRGEEENPFHTEIGYWLWDAADGQVIRSLLVPRGSAVLAGGPAQATDTTFSFEATCGSEQFGILSNPYLANAARTSLYVCTVTADGDTYSYDSVITIEHARHGDTMQHTDRNVLHRVD